jgi:uncharacterized membrane protein
MGMASSVDEERGLTRLWAIVRTWPGLSAIVLMALVGLGVSMYLTVVHYDAKITLACTNNSFINCQDVTSSAWSVVPGTTIPITIPGMIWFLVSGGLAVWGLAALARGAEEPARERLALLVWSSPALAFVLYLVFVEIVDVRKLCEWCTVVHILTLATFLIALTRWLHRNDPMAEPEPHLAPTAPIRRPPAQALSRRAQTALRQRAARGR